MSGNTTSTKDSVGENPTTSNIAGDTTNSGPLTTSTNTEPAEAAHEPRRGAPKPPKRGPNGTPDEAYLEADTFLPAPQFDALHQQLASTSHAVSIAATPPPQGGIMGMPSAAHSRTVSTIAGGSPMLGGQQDAAAAVSRGGSLLSGVGASALCPIVSTPTVHAVAQRASSFGDDAFGTTATTATAVQQQYPKSGSESPLSVAAFSSNNGVTTAEGEVVVVPLSHLSNKRVKVSALMPKLRQKSLRPLVIKTLRAAVTNYLYAAVARLIIGIVKSLLKCGLSKKKFLSLATREVFTANPFKWGTVTAGLSCYRLLQQLVLRASPHMPVKLSCAIGGGLASLSLMALNVHTRTELGLYLGVRAMHGALCSEWEKLPMPESWKRYKDWSVIYMMVLAGEILYTYSFYPSTHSPAYVKFFDSNAKHHPDTMPCLAALVRQQYSPYFMKLYKLHGMNIVTPEYAQMAAEGCGGCALKPGARVMNVNDLREACLFLHPYTNSCLYHYMSLSVRHFWTISIPLYLPLKVSTTLLFGFKRAIKKPFETARKVLQSSLTSSAFLTLYACCPHLILCSSSKAQLHSPFSMAILCGFCGLSTFLEPRGRRNDLALYCSLHGLRSFVNLLHMKGVIPKPTREWVFWLQTVAIASLFYQYDEKYEYIHSNIQALCGWLLKETRRSNEEIAYALEWQRKQDAIKSAILADPNLLSTLVQIKEADEVEVDAKAITGDAGDDDEASGKKKKKRNAALVSASDVGLFESASDVSSPASPVAK